MAKTFPRDARLARMLGVLRILHHNGGQADISELAKLSKSHVDVLLPQITAAKMLGLITSKKGTFVLTPLGLKVHKNDKSADMKVLSNLKKYEPFRTAAKKAESGFSIEDLAVLLTGNGVFWHTNDKKNLEAINDLLVQWGIFFKMASYNWHQRKWMHAKS